MTIIICTRVVTKVILAIAWGTTTTETNILQDLAAAIQIIEKTTHLILSLQSERISDGLQIGEFALVEVGHIGEDDRELREEIDEVEGDADNDGQF